MGEVLEFKRKKIEPAIDKATFLSMILNEQKRDAISRKFDQVEYEEEQFFVNQPQIFFDED